MPKGTINLETGYTYVEVNGNRTQTLPEILLRIPVDSRLEVRLVNFGFAAVAGRGNDLGGLLDPQLGIKLKLRDGIARRKPDLALIAVTSLPIGAHDFRVNDTQPTVKLAWYYQATSVDGFGGNLNASLLGPDLKFTQYAASVYWSRTLSSRTNTFVEVYQLIPAAIGGPSSGFVDVGVTYLLNPATQLDFRLGTGLHRSRDGAFIGAGVSFRF